MKSYTNMVGYSEAKEPCVLLSEASGAQLVLNKVN